VRRVFGLETEYGFFCRVNGNRLPSRENVIRYVFEQAEKRTQHRPQWRGGGASYRLGVLAPLVDGKERRLAHPRFACLEVKQPAWHRLSVTHRQPMHVVPQRPSLRAVGHSRAGYREDDETSPRLRCE
jgi:hypothetical protein